MPYEPESTRQPRWRPATELRHGDEYIELPVANDHQLPEERRHVELMHGLEAIVKQLSCIRSEGER